MPLLDGRPPAVDNRFRPGNPYTCTFQWPAGSLTGRTFTATLDAAALTLNIVGNDMVVSMTPAQTTAAANVGDFKLTETTGGVNEVIIVGSWHSSNGPSAGESTSVTVNESAGVVTVTTNGVSANEAGLIAQARVDELPTLENGTRTTVDTSVPGQVSVDLPRTVTEVRSPTPFTQVANTTSEVTIFTSAFAADELVDGSVINWTLMAGLLNNSGAAANFTLLLKCNGTTVWTMGLTALPSGAGDRIFYADLPCTLGVFSGVRTFGRGRWSVGLPNNSPTVYLDQVATAGLTAVPATAHNWTLTGQFSAASTNLVFTLSVAQALYRP